MISILLFIVGYVLVALPTGIYSRNRSYTKSFKRWSDGIYYTVNEPGYENWLLNTHKKVMRYDCSEISTAGILGAIFWPVFIIGFGWHFLYKKIEAFLTPRLPKGSLEKAVLELKNQRDLEINRKIELNRLRKLIAEADKLKLDTSALKQIMKDM